MSGYHKAKIAKGVLGEVSKIEEEFLEFQDALNQGSKIMALVELSDMIGAIKAYLKKDYNLTLDDLMIMDNLTRRAFEAGHRS